MVLFYCVLTTFLYYLRLFNWLKFNSKLKTDKKTCNNRNMEKKVEKNCQPFICKIT